MKKKSICLFCVLLLQLCILNCRIAFADKYVQSMPNSSQISEKEAIEIACDFIEKLSGVKIEGIYSVKDGIKIENKAETAFGPGYQYFADTNEACWMLHLPNKTTIEPLVVIHGTTGEVLYWEYDDNAISCTYINMMPSANQLSRDQAIQIAIQHFEKEINSTETLNRNCLISQATFGSAANWLTATDKIDETIPIWKIDLLYGEAAIQYIYTIMINADNCEIFDASLYKYASSDCDE